MEVTVSDISPLWENTRENEEAKFFLAPFGKLQWLHGRGCRETKVHLMTAMMQRECTCLWLSPKGTQSVKGCCTHLRCKSSLDYLFGNGFIDTSIHEL